MVACTFCIPIGLQKGNCILKTLNNQTFLKLNNTIAIHEKLY